MKARLKPEEEIILTPGPQAVDDLVGLPTGLPKRGDWYTFYKVGAKDHLDRSIEYHERLSLNCCPQLEEKGGSAVMMELAEAKRECSNFGGFLPSLPLMIAIIDQVSQMNYEEAVSVATYLLEESEDVALNSILTQDSRLVHYPTDLWENWKEHHEPRQTSRRVVVPSLTCTSVPGHTPDYHENFMRSLTGKTTDDLAQLAARLGYGLQLGPWKNDLGSTTTFSLGVASGKLAIIGIPVHYYSRVRMVKE